MRKKGKKKTETNKRGGKTPRQKVEAGIPWRVPFIPDEDVAVKILDEFDNSKSGAQYNVIINNKLREAFSLSEKRAG